MAKARGTSITARLAILALVTTACYGVILAISSRGFARLNGAVAQVNRAQGTFVHSANNLLAQCNSLELFVLSHAMKASSGATGGGSSSRPALEAISNSAKAAASGLQGLQVAPAIDEARAAVLVGFSDYMQTLEGLPEDLDAGGERLSHRVDAAQNAFLSFSNSTFLLLAALREMGDRAASDAARLTQTTSLTLSGVIIGAILFFVAISVFIIRSITKPLGGLVAEVQRIGAGDLTAKMGMARNDELGKIAASVDGLALDLRALIGSAKDRLTLLEDTGRSLSATMAETGAAVVQINSSISRDRGARARHGGPRRDDRQPVLGHLRVLGGRGGDDRQRRVRRSQRGGGGRGLGRPYRRGPRGQGEDRRGGRGRRGHRSAFREPGP